MHVTLSVSQANIFRPFTKLYRLIPLPKFKVLEGSFPTLQCQACSGASGCKKTAFWDPWRAEETTKRASHAAGVLAAGGGGEQLIVGRIFGSDCKEVVQGGNRQRTCKCGGGSRRGFRTRCRRSNNAENTVISPIMGIIGSVCPSRMEICRSKAKIGSHKTTDGA